MKARQRLKVNGKPFKAGDSLDELSAEDLALVPDYCKSEPEIAEAGELVTRESEGDPVMVTREDIAQMKTKECLELLAIRGVTLPANTAATVAREELVKVMFVDLDTKAQE